MFKRNGSNHINTKELENNFSKHFQLFNRLNIFNNEIDLEQFVVHEIDNSKVEEYVQSIRKTLLQADIDKAPLVIFICELIELGLKVYNDYKQYTVIVLFLLEEFDNLFLYNNSLEKTNENIMERLKVSERMKHFNVDKINAQEKLINEQSLNLIDRKVKLQKLEEKLSSSKTEAEEFKNAYNNLCQEFKSLNDKFIMIQRDNDKLKTENQNLMEKMNFVASTLQTVFK